MQELGPTIQELFNMSSKVALVTGGAMGLGLDEACALADLGAEVIVTSRKIDVAEKAAKALSIRTKKSIRGWQLDVTDEKSVLDIFEKIESELGRLDVLVNNAGGAPNAEKTSIFDRELKDWDSVLRTNLTGAFLCTRSAANIMKKQKSGSIINISSVTSLLGRDPQIYEGLNMRPNLIDYSSSKAGMLGLTREAAAVLGGYNIRVNAVLPGGFERKTLPKKFVKCFADKTALGRMGRDRYDIKGVIALLASDAGAYITGETIVVDGGFRIFK